MGNSDNWQTYVSERLNELGVIVLNPRRSCWDSSWMQSIHNPEFNEQVTWELDHLDIASEIFMYFSADSHSPITLLEFGLHANKGNITIVCPQRYWRRGNIEIVAERYGLTVFETLDEGISHLKTRLNDNKERTTHG